MVLYILSNKKKIGGVFQWESQIKHVEHGTKIIYDIDCIFESGDIIYVNNYTKHDFFDGEYLQQLVNKSVKLFFVVHSDLCPINQFFVTYARFFDGVISTNKFVKDKITKIYPNLQNIYLPNTTFVKNNLILKSEPNRLHYVGRLSPEKNIPMLLQAIKYTSDINLFIYGDTKVKYCGYLNLLCELMKIKHKVFFMGFTENKFDLYNKASAVILPSVHEGLPYCLLEAESYGVPVIYNDFSKISNHIKNDSNVNYEYEGYSKELDEIMYVKNYNQMLKMIGYIDFTVDVKDMIVLNKVNNNSSIKIKLLNAIITYNDDKIKVKNKYIVPPFLVENSNKHNLYEKNVTKIVKSINRLFFKI